MKKALSLFMACAMTAAALAGCSPSAKGEETKEAVTVVETTAETLPETGKETAAETTAKAAETTEASEADSEAASSVTLRVGSLKGPTSMGLVSLMDKSEKGEAKGNYEFTMVTDASELAAKMVSGDLDIALVPANMAGLLYQKTSHGIQVLDINTLGVLYVVSSDDSIQSIADLKGKTICMTGKGTTPDHALQFLLKANGLTSSDVTLEYKSEATEVAAVLKEQPDAIGLLPQPFVTSAMAQNENLKMVLDLTEEWNKVQAQDETVGSLVTGVTVARSPLLGEEETEKAVRLFMEEHKASAEFANTSIEETAQLVAKLGIVPKAPIAQKAIPYCSITYIDGQAMADMLHGYLNVLYEQDPASIGGELPDPSFYYIP